MKNKLTNNIDNFPCDLKLVIFWVILTDAFVLLPFLNETFLRIIFAWTAILFLPGYMLIAFLFPEKDDLDVIERVALSFGLSAAIVPVLGLILNFTPFGIRLLPIVIILSLFIILFSILTYLRLKKIPRQKRFNENFSLYNIYVKNVKFPKKGLDKALFVILILSVAFCIFTLIFVVSVPKAGEKFTEFYILNENGTAGNYSTNLSVGEKGFVNINVVSYEHEKVEYRLLIEWDNETLHEEEIFLDHNEPWSRNFTFTADAQGTKKLKFLLYKGNEIYRDLHLEVKVN